MLNPAIHMICGKCGCNHELTFKISEDYDDDAEKYRQCVYISCGNCGTLTGLDEIIKEEKDVD